MRKWKAGIDLMDGGPNLLDLRFADDIIICARPHHELGQVVASLTIHLEQVGLLLNADKTVVLTNDAQPPPILATDGGLKLAILQRNVGQSGWVVCWQPKGHNHNTSIWNIICSKHRNLFTQTVGFYWTEAFPFPNA